MNKVLPYHDYNHMTAQCTFYDWLSYKNCVITGRVAIDDFLRSGIIQDDCLNAVKRKHKIKNSKALVLFWYKRDSRLLIV